MEMARCRAVGLTDVGRVRRENQDCFYIDNEIGIYIVADGMGGLREGGLAARFVVKRLPFLVAKSFNPSLGKEIPGPARVLAEIFNRLSRDFLIELGSGAGAAVVLALLRENSVWIAHLGDSSAWRLRGKRPGRGFG